MTKVGYVTCAMCGGSLDTGCYIECIGIHICKRCRGIGRKLGLTDDALMRPFLKQYLDESGKIIKERLPSFDN